MDLPADQGHEPGVHRQGRLLHRHQAGAARDRDRGHRSRTARHPRLAGRRAVSARGAGQGLADPGLRRPPRRHHRGRVRPGVPGPAGQLAGGLGAELGRPPGRGGLPIRPGPRPRPGGHRDQRAGPAAGRGRPGHGAGARGRHPAPGSGRRRRDAGAVGGRGGAVAARRVAGRGDPGVPGLRRARARAAELPAAGRGRPGRAVAGDRGDGDRERRVPGHRGSRARRHGPGHRQADRRRGAGWPGQRTGHPGRIPAAPPAQRRPLAPGAQGPRARFGLGPGRGAPGALRSGLAPGGLVQPRRARRDPGDRALGSRRTGRVPHPRGLLRRARPSPEGALPRRRAGRAARLPDRHGGDRPVVRGRGRGLRRPLVHAGQPRAPVVRARFGGAGHRPRQAGPGDRGGRGRVSSGAERAG